MFKCDCCGACCRHISLSEIYSDLDRGDGVCRFLDEETSLCTIYENRPIKCNVDAMFETYFSREMTREEYEELNYTACRELKTMASKST
jgi:hypothetical protein